MNYEEIRLKHNLLLILLHGSQVTGKTHSKSDYDVAIVRNDKNKNVDLLELISDLGSVINGFVDVSDITFADPLSLFAVVNKCKLLAGNVDDFKSLEKTAFFKYSDYMPYLKMESDFITKKINNYAKN